MEPTDPKFTEAIVLLRRTGMTQFQLRFDEEQDPVVWVAVAAYKDNTVFVAGVGMSPWMALFDLCERVIDGGTCKHCGRPSVFVVPDGREALPETGLLCSYKWEEEREVYERGCA